MTKLLGILICVPLYTIGTILLGASVTFGLFVFHIAVVPLVFKYSKTFRRSLIFANFVQWPPNIDFEDPSARGIDGARNLSIEYYSKVDKCPVKIGLWHVLPKSAYERLQDSFNFMNKDELNKVLDDELVNSTDPVILYCHGNSNSRAAAHRIKLYKFFQNMDYHVIAFDYRGYGDSSNLHPTESGVVEDALVVYEWLHSTVDRATRPAPVFIWGHSLGTGISSHLLGDLASLSTGLLDRDTPLPQPKGLILESPFNNLADEVAEHPLSKLVTWLPYYEATFVSPFRSAPEYTFKSDLYLSRNKDLPILILHAKDDMVVPLSVAKRLYNTVKRSREDGGATIKIHVYEKSEKLGHKYICDAKDLHEVVGKFVKEHQ